MQTLSDKLVYWEIAVPSSRFLVEELVSDGRYYGRVASLEQYTRDTGRKFDFPEVLVGEFPVIISTGDGYAIAPAQGEFPVIRWTSNGFVMDFASQKVRKVYDPRAEILELKKIAELSNVELGGDLDQSVDLSAYEKVLGAEFTQRLRERLQQKRSVLEAAANRELAQLREQAQRDIQYLEGLLNT